MILATIHGAVASWGFIDLIPDHVMNAELSSRSPQAFGLQSQLVGPKNIVTHDRAFLGAFLGAFNPRVIHHILISPD